MKVLQRKLFGILTLVFLLIIFTLIVFTHRFNQVVSAFAKTLPASIGQKIPSSSVGKVSIEENKILVKLDISAADRPKMTEFSQNLGIDESWGQGISVSLDEQTANYLSTFLPAEVILTMSGKEISFDSGSSGDFFDPSLMKEIYHVEFDNGKLSVQDISGQGYQIDVENPEKVLSGLSFAGKLKLSERLADANLWQLAAKFARIKIRVGKNSLKGVATLK